MKNKKDNSLEIRSCRMAADELLQNQNESRPLVDKNTNISEIKQSGENLPESENIYFQIFNAVPEAIFIQKKDGTFLDVNNGATKMYGYSREEFIGRNPGFIAAPGKNNLAQIEIIIERVVKTGKTEQFEFWGSRKNGEVFPQEMNCNVGKYFGEDIIITTAHDISVIKQSEKVLMESEEKHRMLLNLDTDAFFRGDVQGNFNACNYIAVELTGYPRDELLKMNMKDLFPAEIPDNNSLRFDLLRQVELIKSERKIIRKNGSSIFVDMTSTLMPDGSFQSFFRDITERKSTEDALKKSTARLNRAELTSKAGNWEFHLDTGKVLASEGAIKLYGFSGEDSSIQEIQKIPLPEYRRLLDNSLHQLIVNGEPYNVEFKIKRLGTDEILDIHSLAEYDKKKNIVFGVIQDISERKRAEKIQKVLYNISGAVNTTNDISGFISFIKNELGTLLDTTNFLIAFYDETTDMLSAPYYSDENDDIGTWPASNSLTGYVIQTNKPLLVKKDDLFKKDWLQKHSLVGTNSEVWLGVPLREEGKVTGAFVVQSYSDPNAYNANDVEMLEFISDQISVSLQRKKAEQAVIAAKEKAEESDRLKTAFLANMSHEIRTPMNGILGFAELLDDDTLTQESRREFISIISSSSKQLLTVINDIIDISKIESGQLVISNVRFNLNELLHKVLMTFENVKTNAGKSQLNLLLEKGFSDRDSNITCDDVRLSQVLNNLLGNALKFTSSGFIKCGYRHENGNLLFYVEDTGKGIPEDKQQFIFERFRQVEESNTRQFGGTGLGLSISKGLVELMGGTLWVNSDKNKGSTFYFTLPGNVMATAQVPVQMQQIPKPEGRFNGLTILIAEDILSNFNLLQIMLQKTGATLLYAEDGAQAVKICRDHDDIDLVLMDIQMPEMNGFEATREIRKFLPDLPIIALTAYAFEEDKIRVLDAGCNDFIAKPIDKEGLISKLSEFLLK